MELHTLKAPVGARTSPRRVGRGIGSGLGKTAGRGHKGQKARSGGGKGPAFEGGQTPLQRRLPKRGFRNIFKKEYAIVNVGQLARFPAGAVITPELLLEEGLIKKVGDGVKLLGQGEPGKALTVRVHQASRSAVEKIEGAGGKVEVI
ncbi:MAG: 50S ribosomal protein L15 [Bacillota bacterium]|nr:50S ribosomal protein L15 [Bacillota bacterium]